MLNAQLVTEEVIVFCENIGGIELRAESLLQPSCAAVPAASALARTGRIVVVIFAFEI